MELFAGVRVLSPNRRRKSVAGPNCLPIRAMTEDDASQVAALKREIELLRRQLQQRSVDSADSAITSTRRDYRHERDMSSEQDKTAAAQTETSVQRERADAAQRQHANLESVHAELLKSSEFNRQVLAHSTDCIKVLDLDGRLEFMSEGGMRVMEIDDFAPFAQCPWPEFWQGDERGKAAEAVAAAVTGTVARFEGRAATAKGNLRWWEVVVSPINGPDGKPVKLLSISRDISARHEAEEHRRVLFDEMHHRTKNTLAAVQALVHQSMRHAPDMATAGEAIRHRLVAMGKAHDLLIQREWISADIGEVVRDAVNAYMGPGVRMDIAGGPLTLSSRAALSFAMLLNELCTNAAKHGAWSNKSGRVQITWKEDRGSFRFMWVERGGPLVAPPARRGFGSRLIADLLPNTMGGKATVSFEPAGFSFQFDAPTAQLKSLD
jgi:two-component sensor histidine kinase